MDKFDSIIKGLKYVPASVGMKILQKFNPKFKNFFTSALSYGYDANNLIDFLSSRFGGKGDYEGELEQRREAGNLRPDEAVTQNEIGFSKFPAKALKTGAAIGLGALAGGPLGAATAAADQAVSSPASEQMASTPSDGAANFIAKHPELGAYLDELIQSGMSPEAAAMQAKKVKKLKPSIEDIESSLGQDLVDIISYLFRGKGENRPSETPQKSTISPAMGTFLDALKQFKSIAGKQGG